MKIAVTDLQIYGLAYQRPGIRASQIAEALGADLVEVSKALRCLVDIGDLERTKSFDDATGRAAQVYKLSEKFQASREFQSLLHKLPSIADRALPDNLVSELSKAGQAALVEQVTDGTPSAQPVSAPSAGRPSKSALALDFILQHGGATNQQLHQAMGLPKGAYVSSYMGHLLQTGKLYRDGDLWLARALPVPAPNPVPRAKAAPLPAPLPAPAPDLKDANTAPPLRTGTLCAIWSDGTLEVRTDGATVACLTMEEARTLAAFMGKVGVAA